MAERPPARRPRPRRTLRQRRRKEAVRAAVSVADALAFAGLTEPVRAHRLVLEWPQIVGERIAAKTWPDGLKEGVLWVRVATSAWLQELTLLRGRLLEQIRAALGPPELVAELRLHLGARRQVDVDDALAVVAQQRRRAAAAAVARPATPPATGAARAQIEREVEAVEDPELRALIAAVRIRHDR